MGNPKGDSGSSGGSQSGGKGGGGSQPTRSSIAKEYGGMHNFMNSYGIKPYEAGGYEQANSILDSMIASDNQAAKGSK